MVYSLGLVCRDSGRFRARGKKGVVGSRVHWFQFRLLVLWGPYAGLQKKSPGQLRVRSLVGVEVL